MILWCPLAMTVLAVIFDLKTREIPNAIPVGILATAFVSIALGWLPLSVGASLAGALLALVLGCLLFRLGGWGGGDVKLLIGLGAWLGPVGLLMTGFWMGIIGAALAVATAIRGGRDLAYAPAIAAGLAVYLMWPGALMKLIAG